MTEHTKQRRVGRVLLGLAAAGALVAGVVTTAQARSSGTAQVSKSMYIVQLADAPAVAYTGGVPGLKATKPAAGKKIDPLSTDVVKYVSYLTGKHDAAIKAVGGGRKLYSYAYSYNGFAAELSAGAAAKLQSLAGVVAVSRNETYQVDTSSTPEFLGLTDTGGLWDQLGGVDSAGDGVIVGIVDGGIWPEHPSFSDRTGVNGNATKDGKLGFQQIPGWHGKCVPGDEFTAANCNQKLIGARYYNEGWGGNAGIDSVLPHEYNSPRDFGGHGTHTASTAAGNNGVAATGDASLFGTTSGIAPRARIAAYKACWAVPGTSGSCQGVDLVAAIDQAVADGVDVINY
ncbi:MAG TPA: S8 family serine peptidase, partial [Acidimicrobiales bacterium]